MEFDKYLALREKAFRLVKDKSGEEMRYYAPIENQPYWTHLMNVHNLLVMKGEKDFEVLLAAILHDVVEDSDVTANYLRESFSERVALLVEVVSKPDNYEPEDFYKRIKEHPEVGTRKIKVADRIDNMLTNYCYSDKARSTTKYVEETERYFVPMSNDTGLEKELEAAIGYYKRHINK